MVRKAKSKSERHCVSHRRNGVDETAELAVSLP